MNGHTGSQHRPTNVVSADQRFCNCAMSSVDNITTSLVCSGTVEPIMEDAELGVLQDTTNLAANEQPSLAGPPAGFIPRSKPSTPPIHRKIRSFQLAKWGSELELTLKPHRCWFDLVAVVYTPHLFHPVN